MKTEKLSKIGAFIKSDQKTLWIILVVILLLTTFLYIIFWRESTSPDDIKYWNYAKSLVEGRNIWIKNGRSFFTHWNTRVSLIALTALVIKFFGVNFWSHLMVGLLSLLFVEMGLVWLVYLETRNNVIVFFTGLLFSFSPLFLKYAHIIYPENLTIAFMLGGIYWGIKGMNSGKFVNWIISSLFFLLGFYTKVTVLIGNIVLSIISLSKGVGKFKQFLLSQLFLGIMIIIVGLLLWKDPLGRFKGINYYVNHRFERKEDLKGSMNRSDDIECTTTLFFRKLGHIYKRVFNKLENFFPSIYIFLLFITIGGLIGNLLGWRRGSFVFLLIGLISFLFLNAFKLNPCPEPYLNPQLRYFNIFFLSTLPGFVLLLFALTKSFRVGVIINLIIIGFLMIVFYPVIADTGEKPYYAIAKSLKSIEKRYKPQTICVDNLRTKPIVELYLNEKIRKKMQSYVPDNNANLENCIQPGKIVVVDWFAISQFEASNSRKVARNPVLSFLDYPANSEILHWDGSRASFLILKITPFSQILTIIAKDFKFNIFNFNGKKKASLTQTEEGTTKVKVINPYAILYTGIWKKKFLFKIPPKKCMGVEFKLKGKSALKSKILSGEKFPILIFGPVRIAFMVRYQNRIKIFGGRYFQVEEDFKRYLFPICNYGSDLLNFNVLFFLYGRGSYEFKDISVVEVKANIAN